MATSPVGQYYSAIDAGKEQRGKSGVRLGDKSKSAGEGEDAIVQATVASAKLIDAQSGAKSFVNSSITDYGIG